MTEREKKDGRQSVEKRTSTSTVIGVTLIIASAGYLIFSVFRSMGVDLLPDIASFNTVFISILMQAFPFMLIGVLVSSIMHVFIPDEWIIRIFPTKHGAGYLVALLAGLLFPVCECAIVPVMTRLVKKGVALPIAVTFMLSAPIINPIVIISTLYAFPGQPEITLLRVGLGLLIALTTGLAWTYLSGGQPVLIQEKDRAAHGCDCKAEHDIKACSCHLHSAVTLQGPAAKLKEVFLHAGDEFLNVGKYLIIGAFMTSLIQTFVPREAFAGMAAHHGFSLFIMMAAAFLFSACSTSDAFIARGFMNRFSTGAIMGFLVFGPMMDIKNLFMLLGSFKKGFVLKLTLLIIILNFVTLYIFAFLLL